MQSRVWVRPPHRPAERARFAVALDDPAKPVVVLAYGEIVEHREPVAVLYRVPKTGELDSWAWAALEARVAARGYRPPTGALPRWIDPRETTGEANLRTLRAAATTQLRSVRLRRAPTLVEPGAELGRIECAGETLILRAARYPNGGLAVTASALGGEPWGTLSVPTNDLGLRPDEFAVKDYSENRDLAAAARASSLFAQTGRRARMPFGSVPIWRLR